MKTGVFTMPFAEYQAAEGVSQSQLKRLGQSPAHLKAYLEEPQKETDALRLGKVIDTAVYEPDKLASFCHIRPETYPGEKGAKKPWHGQANACKQWLKDHADRAIVTKSEFDMVQAVQKSVLSNPWVKRAMTNGTAQLSLFAVDEQFDVQCKCRPDWLSGNAIVDLKTTEDASKIGFAKSIGNYGYDVQAAYYLDLAAALHIGKDYFTFIAVEKSPPYAVAVYQLDEESIEIGRRKYRWWLARYAECLKTNEWPGYEPGIQVISLPDWHKRKAA